MGEAPETYAPLRRRPTIRDVAEHAGVSKSLVSLVLRDSPKVSDKSREAVLASIQTLGYRPSATARSLVSGRSGLVGIITSNALDFFYFEVVEGVSDYLLDEGIELVPLIFHGTREEETERAAIDHFMQLQVEGLMLMGSSLPEETIDELSRDVPITVVGRRLECRGVDVVATDDTRGGKLAAQHLVDLGHASICHITGGSGNGAAEREAGYRQALHEAGLEAIVCEGTYDMDGGRRGATKMLNAAASLPTGVVAANDLCAIGAIDEFRRAGHNVPNEISVVGFDDIALAGLASIDLTTINQPAEDMGRTAARLMTDRISNGRAEGQHVLIEPALVVRSTTSSR